MKSIGNLFSISTQTCIGFFKKATFFLIPFSAILFAGCDHKIPDSSDISNALTQEMANYPAVKVTNVSIINGQGNPDDSHNVDANVTITVNQSDDTVEYYKKLYVDVTKISNVIKEMDDADKQISAADSDKKNKLIDQRDALVKINALDPRIDAINTELDNTDVLDVEKNSEENIAKQYGYASREDAQATYDKIVAGSYIAPAYTQYVMTNTVGGKLAFNALYCKRNDLSLCANSTVTNNAKISINMVKSDNGWVINYNQ